MPLIKNISKLKEIFRNYGFVMTTAELNSEKIYYSDIQRLINEGLIERVKRGYYHWIDAFDGNEVVIINKLFPDAILCMETALFYYQYSDRNPAEWNITIDKNTFRQRVKIEYPFVKAYRIEPNLLAIGETSGEIDFVRVRIYDRDRTICDVLRNMNKMDKEIFNKAIQNYVKDSRKNIPNLMQYAKKLRVQQRVKDLIGVWL
ncbi:MAG: type IV toxin-antitoxin system AbiEi family antitoxin domain-containing protein [Oscillospiraceae bacterium]|nr:type IV toxin-antitoxin system AbiEi family antitoxin domain-containing protein [Oscillospiraceae bacterium]